MRPVMWDKTVEMEGKMNTEDRERHRIKVIKENQRLLMALIDVRAENARLTEAIETIAYMGHDAPMTWCWTDLDWANRRAGKMQLIAKDALK